MLTLYQKGFDPPYESPLEHDLAWHLTKYLGVLLFKQVDVPLPGTTFRLDLAVVSPRGRVVAFECDGKDAHADGFRDRCRDALILDGMGGPAAIYRFRGKDLHYYMNDCLYVVGRKDPEIFPDWALGQLGLLASDEVKSVLEGDGEDWAGRPNGYDQGDETRVYYRGEARRAHGDIRVERRTIELCRDAELAHFLTFAKARPRGSVRGRVLRLLPESEIHRAVLAMIEDVKFASIPSCETDP